MDVIWWFHNASSGQVPCHVFKAPKCTSCCSPQLKCEWARFLTEEINVRVKSELQAQSYTCISLPVVATCAEELGLVDRYAGPGLWQTGIITWWAFVKQRYYTAIFIVPWTKVYYIHIHNMACTGPIGVVLRNNYDDIARESQVEGLGGEVGELGETFPSFPPPLPSQRWFS